MEFSKTYRISTDYKDQGHTPQWDTFQFAEVIFVDKTNPANHPLIYQLNDQKLSLDCLLNINHALSFTRDSFFLVGEAIHIDKKKKQITLTNKNTIAYNHLVIASGNKTALSIHDDELVAALQALTDALRVKPKIPASFPSCFKCYVKKGINNETSFPVRSGSFNLKSNVEKIVHPYIVSAAPKSQSSNLNTLNKRLYEVHI